MVRPSQERQTTALTLAQSDLAGDGIEDGENIDIDAGGTGGDGGGVITPPAAAAIKVIEDAGPSLELDFSVANWWYLTLTEDCTVTIVNAPPSGVAILHLIIEQDGTGGWDITWPAEVEWPDADMVPGGSPPTLHSDPGARDWVDLWTADGGTSYGGSFLSDTSTGGGGGAIELQEDGVTRTATMATLNVRHGLDADASGNVDVDESELTHNSLSGLTSGDPHSQYRLEADNHNHESSGAQGGTLDEDALALTDVTTNNSSTSKHGFLKKLDNNSAHFMDGQGAWSTPDHGSIGGLGDDDHTQYTRKDTLTTKGDVYAATAASTPARVGVGTNGQRFVARSGATPGVAWEDDTILVVFPFGGAGVSINVGDKVEIPDMYAVTITRATLVDDAGTISVEVKKATQAGYPGSLASITGGVPVAISSGNKVQDSTLSGWTTSVTDGDTLEASVTAVSGSPTVATLSLRAKRA